MTGKAHYETYLDSAGMWRWRLVAANGEPIAASESYGSKSDAQRGIEDAREASRSAEESDGTNV